VSGDVLYKSVLHTDRLTRFLGVDTFHGNSCPMSVLVTDNWVFGGVPLLVSSP
jgi:hypothetical protein